MMRIKGRGLTPACTMRPTSRGRLIELSAAKCVVNHLEAGIYVLATID
jgi:hypothetical protein